MMTLMVLLANVAFAATSVGVVIIGGSDFKTPDFYKYAKDELIDDGETRYEIFIGNDMQSKYMEYWLEQGYIEEQKPNKQTLVDFVVFSKCDKVLFLVVKDPQLEKSEEGFAVHNRVSIQTNAILCDGEKILSSCSATRNDDSYTSDLRAKRGAFQKCLEDIGVKMKPEFKKIRAF